MFIYYRSVYSERPPDSVGKLKLHFICKPKSERIVIYNEKSAVIHIEELNQEDYTTGPGTAALPFHLV